MARTLLMAAVLAIALAAPAEARNLTKRGARHGAVTFMHKIVWSFDKVQHGEKYHVRPPRFCKRVSHVTVDCPITVRLVSTPTTLRGYLRIHRTSQGLLGYRLPWDPYVISNTLGQPSGL